MVLRQTSEIQVSSTPKDKYGPKDHLPQPPYEPPHNFYAAPNVSTTVSPPAPETVLEEAQRLVYDDRAASYGPTLRQHKEIAAIWSVILGSRITAEQVALCMAGMKLVRIKNTLPSNDSTTEDKKKHRDSVVDLAGYAGVIGRCAEERGWW